MVCADSGRSEELRHRKDIRQRALAPPTLDQFGAAVEKTWELPIARGTLCGSLGIETRDSPKGSVCSSSPRGITPLPSSGVIKYAANTIAIVDRTHGEGRCHRRMRAKRSLWFRRGNGDGMCGRGRQTQHRWSPRYVKQSVDDGQKEEIAAIDPDF